MKPQIIEVERLSDEKQVQVIREVFNLTTEEATKMADAIYSRGMEIVRTANLRIEGEISSPSTNHEPIYYIAKKFLQGGVTIRQLAKEEGIGYNKLYAQISAEVRRVSRYQYKNLNTESSRKGHLEYFKD